MTDFMNHEYVQKLKHNQTKEELKFFHRLQSVLIEHFPKIANGVHKQHPVQHDYGFYILDFFIGPIRLAFEIDGGYHWRDEQINRDLHRDSVLGKKCIKVIHIPNSDVDKRRKKKLTAFLIKCIIDRLSDYELYDKKSEDRRLKREFIIHRQRQHLREVGCDAMRGETHKPKESG